MLVNNELFILKTKDFPVLPPEISEESRLWWKEQFKRCIEGYSVGGKWMPPNLYFYINFWDIEMNLGKSKTKVIARPFLRDIEWLIGNAWIAARGFNGFTDDEYELNNNGIYEKLQNGSLQYKSGRPLYDNESKDLMLLGPRDFGKFLRNSESLIYQDGERPIGDVKVGDKIYGRDGKLTTVLGVYPQGVQDIYELKLSDGRISQCGLDHLWGVYKGRSYKVLTTEELIKGGLSYDHKKSGKSYKYHLPEIEPIQFPERNLPVDPYILGALIGDGKCSGSLWISAHEKEILDNFKERLPDYDFVLDNSKNNTGVNISYHITYKGDKRYTSDKYKNYKCGVNPLYREISALGLNKTAIHKFIPDMYKYSSVNQRMELLQGLLDTDGSITSEGAIEFISCSEQLAKDVLYLARSLGIRGQLGIDNRIGKVIKMPQGTTRIIDKLYYRVYLRTDLPVFKLKRKLDKILKRKRNNRVAIVDIKLLFSDEATCITVDNEDKLFLTNDFIPTHNSFIASGMIIAHEWIFDGRKDCRKGNVKYKSHIAVGAGETKYSGNLLSKFAQGYTTSIIQKSSILGNVLYPHPFSKKFTGTLVAGKDGMIAKYSVKVGGEWKDEGSFSTIRHFSYKNNEHAAQGTRNSVMVKEEIGEFDNYLDTYAHDRETMADGGRKFGSSFEIGTGGNMNKGTIGAYKKFYDPETYDLLTIDDKWENRGKIGMFIPGTMRFNDYKDNQGNTDHEKALDFINSEIEKKKKGKNRKAVLDYIQYNPRVPSEIFLQNVSNIFPVNELQYILAKLETDKRSESAEYIGELFYNTDGHLEYKDNPELIPVKEYPINKSNANTGCFIIYEMPYKQAGEFEPPYGMYLAGYDPYFQDVSTTDSVGSSFIYNKVTKKIVAEYVGRPETDKKYNENLKKLLKFYNAKCLYENQIKGFFDYLDSTNETFLLADQPECLKDIIQDSRVNRGKGCHMTTSIKEWGERLIRDWLLESVDGINENFLNLHNLRSIGLLRELILYNHTGNFDRVMSFMMVMILDKETKRIVINESKQANKLMHETGFFSAFNKLTDNVLHDQQFS